MQNPTISTTKINKSRKKNIPANKKITSTTTNLEKRNILSKRLIFNNTTRSFVNGKNYKTTIASNTTTLGKLIETTTDFKKDSIFEKDIEKTKQYPTEKY